MENRSVFILGSSSATPTKTRWHSAQFLELGPYRFLIDCGEGTQYQLLRNDIRFFKLNAIFISHLHGDHYLGLFGLLNSLGMAGRNDPLKIFAPPGLKKLFEMQFELSRSALQFDIEWIDLKKEGQLLDYDDLDVYCASVKHRIPCFAFKFIYGNKLKPLNAERCKELNIPVEWYMRIKAGEDYRDGDVLIKNEELCFQTRPKYSYVYITDTGHVPELIPFAKSANLLYHEATYLDEDKDKAGETYHSTALEAAQFANAAAVKQLIIGHFSSRYLYLKHHLKEAKQHFQNVYLAREGKKFNIH